MSGALEAALRRQRLLTLASLALLVLLAWVWLLLGAGMGMEADASLAPFPHREAMPGMAADGSWATGQALLAFSMWWVMMVAMMLPAAAPVVLLYAKVAPRESGGPPIGAFVGGYLFVWGVFSLAATGLQAALELSGVLAPMTMSSAAGWLSAAILIAAGAYQLSPLKESCLNHCRNPASFLSRHYRPGRAGAFRLGTLHGAYCVGCCWVLMGLLFVGGVMNLAWIALLTLLVAAEKLLPGGRRIALAAGLGLIAWGVLTALV